MIQNKEEELKREGTTNFNYIKLKPSMIGGKLKT